jgi:hypothetical protein
LSGAAACGPPLAGRPASVVSGDVATTDCAGGAGGKRDQAGQVRDSLARIIDSLELEERHRRLLRDRWLDQVVWMEGAAKRDQQRYLALRLTAILGAVLVPALVGPTASGDVPALRWLGLAVSVVVAAASAVEGFLHFGDRWRHYRSMVERLKSEGWRYFELTGIYAACKTHAAGFGTFTERVEQILAEDVRAYISVVTAEHRNQQAEPPG